MPLSVIIFILLFHAFGGNIFASVEKVSYRGWSECYKIQRELITAIICPESGGRILNYSYNGKNIIYEDFTKNGKLFSEYKKEMFNPAAGRFDYGPEKITRKLHDLTWMGEWDVEVLTEYSILLTSQPDFELGVQSTREFTLDSNNSLLIKQTMINISDTTTRWFFWGRTLVPIGGKMLVPMNPASNYPLGWGKWELNNSPTTFHTDGISDSAIITKNKLLLFCPTKNSPRGKYGTNSKEGWMAYGYEDILFIKRFKYFPDKPYGEIGDQIIIFYTSGSYNEMEPISPVATLLPGESYSFSQNWWLFPYKSLDIKYENLEDINEIILNKTTVADN